MHELSIAMSLLDVITETLIRQGETARVRGITIEIGELSGVVPSALETAFRGATRGTELAGCRLLVRRVPAAIWCETCQSERAAAATDLSCGVCSRRDTRLIRGRELDLVSLEMEPDAAPHS
jgi:hydrogenase nickel incorporation protein HypA/HybF